MGKIRLLFLLFIITGCSTSNVYYQKKSANWEKEQVDSTSQLLYTFYMIGDAGDDTTYSRPVLKNLGKRLINEPYQSSGVIYLGDNLYPEGLHKKSSDKRAEDEVRLNAQLDILNNYSGKTIFIPGNHDWDRQSEKGLKRVNRQEKYIEEYLDKKKAFLPSKGCPGPSVVKLAPGVVLLVIDTQWWLHEYEKPSGEKDGCDVRTTEEFMVQFKDLLKKYRNKNVVVAGHHPLYSNGFHGGHFPLKAHIFPFTEKNKKAYIPLPIIGSTYPFYRKYLGHPQDIAHPVYNKMREELTSAMNEYDNVVYVAGHEHNLQYIQKDNFHHIVSGSGAKSTYLAHNSNIDFGIEQKGYSRLLYYKNGEVWVEFFITEPTGNETLVFKKKLFTKEVVTNSAVEEVIKKSYKDQFVEVVPDSNYEATRLRKVFFGDLNRELWTAPIQVPVLDIHYEKGGLTPVKKGGGMQTLSLRMKGQDGYDYSLRGIKKNAMFLTERNLRGTITQDVIYDGMAGSHPYASVVIPSLSKAVGVYHANPTLVYVPDDPVLGDYQEEFGGMFCLFEERPDGNMSEEESFGNSEKVVNYSDAIEKLQKKQNHVIDDEYVLKARLFDIVIGDWDRHDDQWRWATFKKGKQTIYRPIPRDRDQAFFEFDGILTSVANRKWTVRKFQPYKDEIRDIAGFNFNARYFDRSFLVGLTKEEWMVEAKNIQELLTDEVIENAVREFPDTAFKLTGEHIIATMKARRDQLPEFAARYYDVLSKQVSVTGTYDKDYFTIKRIKDGSVEVCIYPRKKGEKVKSERFYKRVFYPAETKEIILYGLGGKDEYKIEGEAKNSILVRIVAGEDKDRIEDVSEVKGVRKMTKIYETEGKNEITKSKETHLEVRSFKDEYDYDRKDFVYDKLMPLVSVGYNKNDGVFIGPGVKYTKQGFKKSPYKYSHKLMANWMFGANGFNLYYEYDYIDVIGKADFTGSFKINNPLTFKYYGRGNELELESNKDHYYNVKMDDVQFDPSLKFQSKSLSQRLLFSLNFRRVNFDETPVEEVPIKALELQHFTGGSVDYEYNNKDNAIHPKSGLCFKTRIKWVKGIEEKEINFMRFNSELSIYKPINLTKKQTTLGIRTGFSTNWGEYFFYQANFLNGLENFRGIPRNRYAGKTSYYTNADLRFSLIKSKNYIVPFDFGVLTHYDIARVWQTGESSRLWHQSFGGGVFINVLDFMMLVGTYSISDEDDVFTFGSKFLF